MSETKIQLKRCTAKEEWPPSKKKTKVYYASLLDKPKSEITEKGPHLPKRKILFHQYNRSCHTSAVARVKIFELRFELLNHPPYSPDLSPSDFFSFPHLKIALEWHRFSSNENNHLRVQLFCREKGQALFGLVKEMGAPLAEKCRLKRRLCGELEINLNEKCCISLLGRNFFWPHCNKQKRIK